MSGLKLTDVIQTVRWGGGASLNGTGETLEPSAARGVVAGEKHNAGIARAQSGNATTRLNKLKQAFLADLPVFMEGKSIAQCMAGLDQTARAQHGSFVSAVTCQSPGSVVYNSTQPRVGQEKFGQNDDSASVGVNAAMATPYNALLNRHGVQLSLTASERVVRSHLRYLNDFEPFKRGVVTKATLYEFMFYMIVEKQRRESYAKRVIKSIMAYLQAGGASGVIDLTGESKEYVDNFRGLGGVEMSIFYRRMDVVSNALNDDDTKRLLSTARSKRPLVFNDDEETRILQHCVSVLRACGYKYMGMTNNKRPDEIRNHYNFFAGNESVQKPPGRDSETESFCVAAKKKPWDATIEINTDIGAAETKPSRIDYERTIFEFSLAYLLGFLSGARIKSTVLRFSLDDVSALLAGGRLEVLTKGVFVNVFLPAAVLKNEFDLYGSIMPLRTRSLLYANNASNQSEKGDAYSLHAGNVANAKRIGNAVADGVQGSDVDDGSIRFFTRTSRQLELMLDRVYKCLFGDRKRTKGVRWHSQRRRYLGTINSKYGAATASESVGHRDLATTLMYINNSLHMDDVRRKAGEAITERYNQFVVNE